MITYAIETITPQMAEEYLKKNQDNYRNISKSVVDAYAEDMKNGKWETNGETISFYENGILFDGQHRLNAVLKSGVAVQFIVVRGIPNETKITDWGKTRTIGNWGKREGITISGQISGAARILLYGFNNQAHAKGVQAAFIKEHYKDLHDSEMITSHGSNHSIGRRAPMLLAVYVVRNLNLVNDIVLRNFFRVFNTGTVLSDEIRDPSAPLILYRQITKYYLNISGAADVRAEQYNLTLQAILDYSRNKNRRVMYKAKDEPIKYLETVRRNLDISKEC